MKTSLLVLRPRAALSAFAAILSLAAGPAGAQVPAPAAVSAPLLPEGASGVQAKPGWSAQRFMVAAANPLATDAGYRILQAGGSAVDAAVAVQMVLALVEPQSSGIGGGAFLLHWDGRQLQALDGRETAPVAADERLFLGADGKPLPFAQAVVGGRSVGVPGAVRLMHEAHRQQGRLPWARLFERAIELAEQGFPVSPRMHALLRTETALRQQPQAAAYFYRADGEPHPVGHLLKNPALASVLRQIAERGSAAFYQGAVAEDIVRRVREHPVNPGLMTLVDLSGYTVQTRAPLCTPWRAWRVCGFPPPSSGHVAVMQILGMVDQPGPVGPQALADGRPGADFLHRYAEVSRLAYADRALYLGDPAFVAAPGGRWESLLDPAYLRERATLVGARSMGNASPGQPPGVQRIALAPQPFQPEAGTSHVSVIDGDGRALALTTTIEAAWGARLMSDGGTGLAGGFLLNNQLTDFSFLPADAQGRPIANRVQPGKRPRSSMSPTLVFDAEGGALRMTLGSPGGATIIHFVAKTLLGTLAFGLDAQRAIDLPNFANLNGPTLLERGRFDAATAQALQDRGHTVQQIEMTSGLQAIERRGGGWFGGADPRREGVAMGD